MGVLSSVVAAANVKVRQHEQESVFGILHFLSRNVDGGAHLPVLSPVAANCLLHRGAI